MHKMILDATIAKVRQRASEGDCPITAAYSVEHLETALLTLADTQPDTGKVEAGRVEREVERIAKCIIGPRRPVPSTSKFSLAELRDVKWEAARADEKADALSAAEAILALRPQPSGETRERLKEMAEWLKRGDPGSEGSVLLSASVAAEHSADLLALIATADQAKGGA